jgi:hypothetical protein
MTSAESFPSPRHARWQAVSLAGRVWRVLLAEVTSYSLTLALELRTPASSTDPQDGLRFGILRLRRDGGVDAAGGLTAQWLPLVAPSGVDERWLGLQAVAADCVLLHGYQDPKRPNHLGLWAYALVDGQLRWGQPALSYFRAAGPGELWCTDTRPLHRPCVRVSLRSGEVLGPVPDSELQTPPQVLAASPAIELPHRIASDDPAHAAWAAQIRQATGHAPLHELHLLPLPQAVVVVYHTADAGPLARLSQWLLHWPLAGPPHTPIALATGQTHLGYDSLWHCAGWTLALGTAGLWALPPAVAGI